MIENNPELRHLAAIRPNICAGYPGEG